MAKAKKALKIEPIGGWFLIAREEIPNMDDLSVAGYSDRWHIAWLEPFNTKKSALAFAKKNSWYQPFKAVRGHIAVTA